VRKTDCQFGNAFDFNELDPQGACELELHFGPQVWY
jgi:hypothetical protein